jgi:soluble cytochrome b562
MRWTTSDPVDNIPDLVNVVLGESDITFPYKGICTEFAKKFQELGDNERVDDLVKKLDTYYKKDFQNQYNFIPVFEHAIEDMKYLGQEQYVTEYKALAEKKYLEVIRNEPDVFSYRSGFHEFLTFMDEHQFEEISIKKSLRIALREMNQFKQEDSTSAFFVENYNTINDLSKKYL